MVDPSVSEVLTSSAPEKATCFALPLAFSIFVYQVFQQVVFDIWPISWLPQRSVVQIRGSHDSIYPVFLLVYLSLTQLFFFVQLFLKLLKTLVLFKLLVKPLLILNFDIALCLSLSFDNWTNILLANIDILMIICFLKLWLLVSLIHLSSKFILLNIDSLENIWVVLQLWIHFFVSICLMDAFLSLFTKLILKTLESEFALLVLITFESKATFLNLIALILM